jgi:hypothetical protein
VRDRERERERGISLNLINLHLRKVKLMKESLVRNFNKNYYLVRREIKVNLVQRVNRYDDLLSYLSWMVTVCLCLLSHEGEDAI